MGLFSINSMKEPVFLKEESDAVKQLEALQEYREKAPTEITEVVDQDIQILKAGIYGEKQIIFELKNSHMPMYVIQDLRIVQGEQAAQIDFFVLTRYCAFLLECKNLIGDIEVMNDGSFIRKLSRGGKMIKEGMYSPLRQNQRHLDLLKGKLLERKDGKPLAQKKLEQNFYKWYQSVVVLANPKTVLNMRYAPKSIKENIVRADKLIEHIKMVNEKSNLAANNDKNLQELAQTIFSMHQENTADYLKKYKSMLQNTDTKKNNEQTILCPKCGAPMILRKASKGVYEGKKFYGCSNYPKCKGIINIK